MSVFDQLIDQDNVTSVLKEAVLASRDVKNVSQQMTHAWLFTGPAGSGRSNAAVAFASALVCPAGELFVALQKILQSTHQMQ